MSLNRRIAWIWLAQVHAHTSHSTLLPFLYQTNTLNYFRFRRLCFETPTCSYHSTSDSSSHNTPDHAESTPTSDVQGKGTPSAKSQFRVSWFRRRATAMAERNGTIDQWNTTIDTYSEAPIESESRTEPRHPSKLEPPARPKPFPKSIGRPKLTAEESATFAQLLGRIAPGPNQDPKELLKSSKLLSNEEKEEQQEMKQIYAIFDSVLTKARRGEKGSQKHAVKEPRKYNRWEAQDSQAFQEPRGSQDFHVAENEARATFEIAKETTKPKAVKNSRAEMGQVEMSLAEGSEAVLTLPDTDQELAQLLERNEMTLVTATKLVVEREASKIEEALQAAIEKGGGSGIWAVCKERIFSMMHKLVDDKGTAPTLEGLDLLEQEIPQQRTQPSSSTPQVPACIPLESVITSLYPRMLLVAFRLLNIHASDSPLISQYRETITSFGRESIFVGSSIALYNEMIYFHWRGEHDLPAVVSLLHQMRVTGMQPDRRTLDILNAIAREHNQHKGEEWWELPPNQMAIQSLVAEEGGWIPWVKTQLWSNKKLSREGKR
ncbi:hypothetical protein BJX70DRAFT_373814 [Aspergillus crustosus]